MWEDDRWSARVLAVAAIAVMAAGVLQPHLPGWGGGEPTAAEASDGGITVERVTNNYTQPARVYVSPVDGRSVVDPFVPFLEPGESAGPASLDCASEYGTATHLRVLVRAYDEGDTIVDQRVEPESGDCGPDGGAGFDVTVHAGGDVTIERRA